jgi:cytochrome c553
MRRIAALLIAVAALPAAADDIAPCLDCHRGDAGAVAPALDGQHAEYLRIQLTRYRDGQRQAFPMEHLVQGFDDAAIARLAERFAARPWFDFPAPQDGERVARGAALAQRHDCAACHGEGLRGGGSIPRLAGQNPVYLAQQIGEFARDERFHPPTGVGGRMYRFDAAAAADLAAWLAAQR